MMRSLFSGVAGLKTHQSRMDVIGNNIANVNTTAYKSSSMVFNTMLSQTLQNSSGPNPTTGLGGVNARQIGLGVKTGAINVNISTAGAAQSTGNPFDMRINGSAFFIVSSGVENFFTRDGSFYVDAAGNLAMTSNGYNVMGWQVDPDTMDIKQDTVSALRVMSVANMNYPPEATSKAYVTGIIDKNDKDVTSMSGKSLNLNFYDELGYSYTAKFAIKQSSKTNEYSIELVKLLDSAGNTVDISGLTFGDPTSQSINNSIVLNTSTYKWDNNKLYYLTDDPTSDPEICDMADLFGTDEAKKQVAREAIAKAYGYEGAADEFFKLTVNLTLADDAANTFTPDVYSVERLFENQANSVALPAPNFTNITASDIATEGISNWGLNAFDTTGRDFTGAMLVYNDGNLTGEKGHFVGVGGTPNVMDVTLRLSELGGNFKDITIDFSTTSMYDNNGTCTISASAGDLDGLGAGRKLGDMTGISIQTDGRIYAAYDNGMTRLLGQIAVAKFANVSGLEQRGSNLYSSTNNSGEFNGVGEDITADGGSMTTGELEMSNVDLSEEFTTMITTQRGFQANSRIITVSDTLLEELTNLKR